MKEISKEKYYEIVDYLEKKAEQIINSKRERSVNKYFSAAPFSDRNGRVWRYSGFTHHFSIKGCSSEEFRNKNCVCIHETISEDKFYFDVHLPGDCKWYLYRKAFGCIVWR